MTRSRCPHCGTKLDDFLYADACPYCQQELKQNTKALVLAPAQEPLMRKAWPIQWLLKAVRLVES